MTFSIFAFEMCNAKSIHTDMSRILLITIFCMWLPLQLMAQGFTVRGQGSGQTLASARGLRQRVALR